MNETTFDFATTFMLVGLALGLLLYLLTAQTLAVALGLGSGCFLGFAWERRARRLAVASEKG